ncbi:hypothetical protein HQN59_04565 [Schlegelella sp. ID0723]|uniref:Uncharacterized protein n=1 Tax=Piscinibacter koreensis TaxID=2742824 RepID=A0A7Y6TVK2_9BURK|nr:hypothetical protein [Schlegelella koreensis]
MAPASRRTGKQKAARGRLSVEARRDQRGAEAPVEPIEPPIAAEAAESAAEAAADADIAALLAAPTAADASDAPEVAGGVTIVVVEAGGVVVVVSAAGGVDGTTVVVSSFFVQAANETAATMEAIRSAFLILVLNSLVYVTGSPPQGVPSFKDKESRSIPVPNARV